MAGLSEQIRFGIDSNGWLRGARRVDSPNHDERPACEVATLLVIHAISLPPAEFGSDAILRFFTNCLDSSEHSYYAQISGLRVSSHFLIRRDGELIQFVSCNARAWHAGVSSWNGRTRCNDFSIGIELEGCDDLPFENGQYEKLSRLVESLQAAYPIDAIVGHSDVSPGRKTDPGPCFDWSRLGFSGDLPGDVR